MTLNFDTAFDRLIGNEGGYVDNPDDPGGETNWGITWPTLREAIALGLLPAETTIKDLTRDQARIVYKALFWDRARMGEYNPAIAFQAFDFAVNSSIETAVRKLQSAVGVADDGKVGPLTVSAIKARSVTDVIMLYAAERLEYMTKLSIWPQFGRGWARRISKDLRYGAQDS